MIMRNFYLECSDPKAPGGTPIMQQPAPVSPITKFVFTCKLYCLTVCTDQCSEGKRPTKATNGESAEG
jgi:hypothetical protein